MKDFIRVDDWIELIHKGEIEYTEYIKPSGKLMVIEFDKLFHTNSDKLNIFVIKKDSYANHSQFICDYINYFLNFYDEEKELILSYYKLRYLVGNNSTKISKMNFIELLYNILLTDSIKNKIIAMVEDNNYIDVTDPDPTHKYNPLLEFTNDDAKVLHEVGLSIKIMTPILFHYLNSNNIVKSKNYLFPFYHQLFYIYAKDVDVYDKLYRTVLSKVRVNAGINRGSYEQREILGTTYLTVSDRLLKENIISENMFKYEFKNNVVNFNSVILNNQLCYFNIEPYQRALVELDHKPNEDGLSGLSKLEIDNSVVDESDIIFSKVAIPDTIARIKAGMPIDLPKEEVDFYRKYHKPANFQDELVSYWYAKYFHGFKDIDELGELDYFELLVLLKRRLQFQGNKYLPQLLTGNVGPKLNTRTIQNSKFLIKIENSPLYQSIMNNNFAYVKEIDKGQIVLNYLSILINNVFTSVDYDFPEHLGEELEINQDELSDEYLNFVKQF